MFKLLTPETRAKVGHEYSLRRAVIIIMALIMFLWVALIGFFPSYLLSRVKKEEATTSASVELSVEEKGNASLWLASFNTKLQALSLGIEEGRVSDVIEKVIAERRAGIRLTEFGWSESEGVAALSITGVASDRQALLAFEKRLNDTAEFGSVTLPVSNLAKESDISFQINLSPKKTP